MSLAETTESIRERIRRRARVSWLPVVGGALLVYTDAPVPLMLSGSIWLVGVIFQFYVGYQYLTAGARAHHT